MSDMEMIVEALDDLRQQGIFSYNPFKYLPCCQSCGCYEVPAEFGNKYVFFHEQDRERGFDGEKFIDPIYLSWGEDVDPNLVKAAFEGRGFRVELPPDLSQRIRLLPRVKQ